MNQKNQKKKPEKNRLSKLRLRSSASVSKNSVSPHVNPREKISSYFASSLNEIASQRESEELFLATIESQYGQKFSSEANPNNEIDKKPPKVSEKATTSTDDNDFAEPKVIKPAKIFEIKPEKVKRKRTRNNNDLKKFVKDFGPSCSDTNQDHLQLAYAMSKSLEEFENPGQSSDNQECTDYESPYPSTQQKLATIKSTLDQFGFKTNRSAVEITTLKNNANQKKFKYLTPTLFLRTEEDRARLIETKVSRIFDNIAIYNKNLQENNPSDNNEEEFVDNKPKSFLLRDYYDENSTIFRKNHLELSEMNESTFYNNIVRPEIIKTGVLLKDWGSIPGREKSPPPLPINITVEETEDILYNNSEKQENAEENKNQDSAEKNTKQESGDENEKQVSAEENAKQESVDENEKQVNADENEKQNNAEVSEINKFGVNTTIDHCISPDLFSDCESELSIKKSLNHPEKSPINKNIPTNLSTSPIIHQIHNSNKEKSPIIVLSSSNSNKVQNSPALSEKEIFSDDSDAKSLSLLDNISPRRNKNKSPKKSINSPFKKSLFSVNKTNTVSLLDIEGVAALQNTKSDKSSSKNSSPFETLQHESQICHYESFCDNSNDYFDLTRSSEDSSDNYNANIVSNLPIKDNSEPQISEKLFASELILTEMGAHDDDNYSSVVQLRKDFSPIKKTNEELIDLTQSSNDGDEVTSKKNIVDKADLILNNINAIEKINTDLQSKNMQEENSNDSIKTVLLIKNISSEIIEATEEIDTVPLQNKMLDLTTTYEEDYSPEFDLLNPSNNKDFYKSLSFISDTESESSKSPKKNIKSTDVSPSKTNLNRLKNTSNNKESTPKLSRRSFNESIIGDKEISFFKLSSPLSITKYISKPEEQNDLITDKNTSFDDIEISDEELNYSVNKSKKTRNINDISQSFNDSKINDEDELNCTINKSKLESKSVPSCSKNLDNNPEDEAEILSQSSLGTGSDISDEELNYSTNVSFNKRKLNNYDYPQVMDFNDLPESGFERTRTSLNINESKIPSEVLKHPRVTDLITPTKFNQQEDSFDEILKETVTPNIDDNNVKTPENTKVNPVAITPMSDYIIKKTNVTPMPKYTEMDSPAIIKELDKFGIKPLKRAKGIKLLQYIYNSTHPILQTPEKVRESSSEEEDRIIKRRKTIPGTRNVQKRLSNHFECEDTVECLGNEIANSEKVENMIFERKQSVRIASCRLPLHIAWHNLLSSNRELHEKILLYEPIQVEEIYAKFKSFGYKFHIQDIISFLDKKCVTIRVAQNNQKKKAGSGS